MLKLQDKISILDQALADASIYSENPQKAADFARLRNKLASELSQNEDEWLELSEELSNA
jgi:ATP-binding cassette subfamily F protein 3